MVETLDKLIQSSCLWQKMESIVYSLGSGDLSCSPFYTIYSNYENLVYDLLIEKGIKIKKADLMCIMCDIAIDGEAEAEYNGHIHSISTGAEVYQAFLAPDFHYIEK